MNKRILFKKVHFFLKRTLVRYICSYLFVFLVPFSIVSISWYKTSSASINEQIELTATNARLQLQAIMSNNLMQLTSLANQIAMDNKLSEFMISQPYYSYEAINELKRYKMNSNLIEEVYVYFYNYPDRLFSSSGILDIPVFIEKRYKEFSFAQLDMKHVLQSKSPKIQSTTRNKKSSGTQGMIEYIVPLRNEDGTAYGSVMYTIKTGDIQSLFDQSIDKTDGEMVLLDDNYQVLLGDKNERFLPSSSNENRVENILKNGKKQAQDNGLKINAIQDKDFGLIYVSLVDPSTALLTVNRMHRQSLIIIGFILFLGVASVVILGHWQYRPLKKLERMLMKKLGDENEDKKLDTLSQIEQHVSSFLQQNEKLHIEIEKKSPLAQEQVIRKVITGRFKEQNEIDQSLKSVGISMAEKNIFVLLIDTKRQNLEESIHYQDELMQVVDSYESMDYTLYGTEMITISAIAIVVSFNENKTQENIVDELVESMKAHVSTTFAIGIGTVVQTLTNVNRSYIEGLAALEYRNLMKDEGQKVFYTKIKKLKNSETFIYPTDEQLKLTQSLTQGDLEVALETIDQLIRKGVEGQQTVSGRKLYGYYLINTVTKTGVSVIGDSFIQTAEIAVDFLNLAELKEKLIFLCEQICEIVEKKQMDQESKSKKEIFTYLDEHYASHDLSLEKMAAEFHLSISYLSRFIKKESGNTFSKYIQELRLKKIKQALVETNRPIKEIILDSGYYDVSNYTRKFKSIVGVTPGQFRSQNR